MNFKLFGKMLIVAKRVAEADAIELDDAKQVIKEAPKENWYDKYFKDTRSYKEISTEEATIKVCNREAWYKRFHIGRK